MSNYLQVGTINIRTHFLIYKIVRCLLRWLFFVKFQKVNSHSMVKFICQNVKLSIKVIDHLNVSNLIFVVDINFFFVFKVDPKDIVEGCDCHSLLVFTKNKEFWLAIQIVLEIEMRLSLLSYVIKSPYLIPVCKHQLVHVANIEFYLAGHIF